MKFKSKSNQYSKRNLIEELGDTNQPFRRIFQPWATIKIKILPQISLYKLEIWSKTMKNKLKLW